MDMPDEVPCRAHDHEFMIILNKSSGGMRHSYVMINHDAHNIAPKVNQVIWPRINDLSDYSSVVMKNCLYIIGGREKSTGKVQRQVLRYDPTKRRWNEMESMLKSRVGHTATVMGGKIYVTGGQLSSNELTSSCESYEPFTDEWHKEPELPNPREDHCVVERSGALYLSGGQSKTQNATDDIWVMQRVLVEDSSPKEFYYAWTVFEDAHRNHTFHKMSQHSLHLCRDKLYFCGGVCNGFSFDGVNFVQSQTEVMQEQSSENPKKMKRLLATANMLECYKFPSSVVLIDNNDLTNDNMKGELLAGDTNQDAVARHRQWHNMPRLLRPRCSAGSAVIGNKIFLVGGHCTEDEEGTCVSTVDYYHVKKRQWHTAFSLGDGDFRSVDCVILTIPVTNKDFKPMCFADCKWVMW